MRIDVSRSVSSARALALAGALALADTSAAAEVAPGPAMKPPAALTAIQAQPPRFPLSLRGTEHTDGYAVVALTVDATGRVSDQIAIEASHPAFAREAESAVALWQFAPAPAATRPPRDVVQFEFRSAGVISTLSHAEAAERGMKIPPTRPLLRTVVASELTPPPAPLSSPAPRLPRAALSRLQGKPVIVSFIIDTDGAVHVPVVDSAADEQVALAVIDAVRAWRFSPPRQAGEPVLVQAYRAFGGSLQ
jgi:TonB family protein